MSRRSSSQHVLAQIQVRFRFKRAFADHVDNANMSLAASKSYVDVAASMHSLARKQSMLSNTVQFANFIDGRDGVKMKECVRRRESNLLLSSASRIELGLRDVIMKRRF